MIRAHTGIIIGLVVPSRAHIRVPNAELSEKAHWIRSHITDAELADSQLPRVIASGKKPTIKPESWYARPDLLQRVLQMATAILGGRGKAFKWMEEENPHLGDMAPIDLVESDEGAALVIGYMERYIASGSIAGENDI